MANVDYSVQGDGSVVQAQERINDAIKRAGQNTKQTAAESKKFDRLGKQIMQRHQTDWETFNKKLEDARKATAGLTNGQELFRKEAAKLKAEYEESIEKVDKLDESQRKTFDVKKLAGYAASFVSIHQAVALITSEFRRQQEIIDKRVALTLPLEASRNVLKRNLVGESQATIDDALQRSQAIAGATNLSENVINQAFAGAISATAGDIDLSEEIVKVAAQFLPDRPGELGEFAGTLGDLTKVTGSEDALVQLGLLSQLGKLSRIQSAELQAKNIAPALIGTLDFGGNFRESGALFTALTGGGADQTGERSGTALVNLAKQLDEFVNAEKKFKDLDANLRQQIGDPSRLSIGGRVALIQQNPELRQAFLEGATFEAKTLSPIRQLLRNPSSDPARDFQAALGAIQDETGLRLLGQQAIAQIDSSPLGSVAKRSRVLDASAERALTSVASEKLSEEEVKKFSQVFETQFPGFGSFFAEGAGPLKAAKASGIGLTATEAADLLEERLDFVERIRSDPDVSFRRPLLSAPETIAGGEEGRALVAELRKIAAETEASRREAAEAQREVAKDTKRSADALEKISQSEGGLVGVGE